eukprot:scaffold272417_cov36-Tisochrysis_lutea.AAC.1
MATPNPVSASCMVVGGRGRCERGADGVYSHGRAYQVAIVVAHHAPKGMEKVRDVRIDTDLRQGVHRMEARRRVKCGGERGGGGGVGAQSAARAHLPKWRRVDESVANDGENARHGESAEGRLGEVEDKKGHGDSDDNLDVGVVIRGRAELQPLDREYAEYAAQERAEH